ncbi:hypothetical protein LBMAG49_15250 [Planctomycetota bacterium]|nr:hypothetical protein LBMAG49_15250 [Planctomycetota bacterium]
MGGTRPWRLAFAVRAPKRRLHYAKVDLRAWSAGPRDGKPVWGQARVTAMAIYSTAATAN